MNKLQLVYKILNYSITMRIMGSKGAKDINEGWKGIQVMKC